MHTIKNLTNSPHDIDSLNGPRVLPAMGSIDAPLDPLYLRALADIGYFEVSAAADQVKDDSPSVKRPRSEQHKRSAHVAGPGEK